MNFLSDNLLTLTIFLPLLFAALVAVLPAGERGQIRALALVGMLLDLALGVALYLAFDSKGAEFQLETRARWLDELGISFHLGVDGLSVSLIFLTVFLGPLVVLASTYVTDRVKELHLALLVLQTAMMGALASMDVIVFYVFWEAMLIPMYLLIGVWGSEERQMAAVKFFLYTLAGSLLMLVAILAVYFMAQPSGARSFDYATLYNSLLSANKELGACAGPGGCPNLSPLAAALKAYGPWLFAAFALAFAIKVPMFPVHTWLPDAHVQAPVAGSMILAGVMLKMGTYGFWRYAMPLFPEAARSHRTLIASLAVVGIVYGALMCLAQRDVKKLIAYSSVSHLGFCMLGMFAFTAEAATGSAYQMLNHGVSTGALFLLFGMLYERRHTRLISDYGGIAKAMPMFAAVFLIITFSSVAVPGTNGFVGEFLVLLGTFKSSLSTAYGVLAATGVILGAAYMLWMVQRVFFGQVTHRENAHLRDLGARELVTVLPLVAAALLMGLYPQPFLERLQAPTERFVARVNVGVPGVETDDDVVRFNVMPLPPPDAEQPKPAQPAVSANP
ncbi:MAG TPA: NADH-quinone oxidoreductase subunit M [Myxococcaceae bacterium]|nr:NADH-quinone oxidoreductase subunit M [Myxococcaceae bacterium]